MAHEHTFKTHRDHAAWLRRTQRVILAHSYERLAYPREMLATTVITDDGYRLRSYTVPSWALIVRRGLGASSLRELYTLAKHADFIDSVHTLVAMGAIDAEVGAHARAYLEALGGQP